MVPSEELYHDPKENYNHAVVVHGRKGNTYFIKDPYLGVKKIPAEELHYAWARAGGWMLVLYR